MKASILVAAGAGLILASPPEHAELAFHPKPGLVLEKTYEQEATLELKEIRFKLGGEDVPRDSIQAPGIALTRTLEVESTDTYAAVEGGRVTKLVRRFGELSGREVGRFTTPQGESESARERTSPMAAKTVSFTWDAGESRKVPSSEDGVAQALLDELEPELDLLLFLPDSEVEEGESWEVDAGALRYLLAWGGDLGWRFEEATDSGDLDRQFLENATGELRAKSAGEREVEGAPCGVVAVVFEIASSGEGQNLSPGMEGVQQATFEIELEGELLWDAKAGVFRSLALEGDGKVVFANEGEADVNGQKVAYEQEREFAVHARFAIEARPHE